MICCNWFHNCPEKFLQVVWVLSLHEYWVSEELYDNLSTCFTKKEIEPEKRIESMNITE